MLAGAALARWPWRCGVWRRSARCGDVLAARTDLYVRLAGRGISALSSLLGRLGRVAAAAGGVGRARWFGWSSIRGRRAGRAAPLPLPSVKVRAGGVPCSVLRQLEGVAGRLVDSSSRLGRVIRSAPASDDGCSMARTSRWFGGGRERDWTAVLAVLGAFRGTMEPVVGKALPVGWESSAKTGKGRGWEAADGRLGGGPGESRGGRGVKIPVAVHAGAATGQRAIGWRWRAPTPPPPPCPAPGRNWMDGRAPSHGRDGSRIVGGWGRRRRSLAGLGLGLLGELGHHFAADAVHWVHCGS